jgi:hypothetical protein
MRRDWVVVARIAPSPIETAIAIGDALSHALGSGVPARHREPAATPQQAARAETRRAAQPPPSNPGEAFAAAVIAGQLPPRPTSVAQLRQRLGTAWQPPASPLRVMDRTA